MDNDQYNRNLDKAKVALMLNNETVFYSVLLLNLNPHYSDVCDTACTDGFSIMINPKFFNELDSDERVFLLVHEAMHVALSHLTRKGSRDHKMWNIAADYVINKILKDRKFKVPENALLNDKYVDWSTEQVYNDIMQNKSKYDKVEPDYDDIQLSEDSNTELSDIEKNMDDILRTAVSQSEIMSNNPDVVPDAIKKYLDKLINPKLPWNIILSRFLTEINKENYSWKRPNKRFMPDYYLPSLYSTSLSRIDIAIDVSGSISQKQFIQFISELYSVIKQFSINEIGVMQFDHLLQSHDVIKKQLDLTKIKFKGGGGTNVKVAIDAFIKTRSSKALIVLTDGEFAHNYTNTGRPVIWAIYNNKNFKPLFGKVINFELR